MFDETTFAHSCDDFADTVRRRDLARRAAATALPVPDQMLTEGAERFLSSTTSRKSFLAGGAGLAIALSGVRVGLGDPRRIFEAAAADAATAGNYPILVMIYQSGGNDGLNTLIPITGEDASIYAAKRTRIGLQGAGLLPLGGAHAAHNVAWNPALTGLQGLYDAGKVAVLPAVDYPQPNLSHFHSAHFWRSGVPDFSQTTGWLGRYLDRYGNKTNPLQGVAVQYSTDEVLYSKTAPTCALISPNDFNLSVNGVWDGYDPISVVGGMSLLAKSRGKSPALRHSTQIAAQTNTLSRTLHTLGKQHTPDPMTLGYASNDGLGSSLANLRRMMTAKLGIRVATLQADGGWDSHQNQNPDQASNLAALGTNLAAWQADLQAHGLADRVITVVWSEFGRRVEDNDSAGTDHGAGGLMLLVGNKVKGGVLRGATGVTGGGWHLGAFNDDRWQGNVPVGIDYRNVYAGLLKYHLKADPHAVLTKSYRGTPMRVVA